MKQLSEKVISVYGSKLDLKHDKNAHHEALTLHLNCDKSNAILKWYPKWNFDITIERTVNWYINHLKGENAEDLTLFDINEFLKAKI